jgi:hypothetical protein
MKQGETWRDFYESRWPVWLHVIWWGLLTLLPLDASIITDVKYYCHGYNGFTAG